MKVWSKAVAFFALWVKSMQECKECNTPHSKKDKKMKKTKQMIEYQLDRLIDTMNKIEKHQGVIAGALNGSDPNCASAFDEIRQAIYSLEFVIEQFRHDIYQCNRTKGS